MLRTLALETGFEEALNAAVGNEDGPALLGLAMHQTAEARPLYLAGDWLEDRELPESMKTGVGPGGVYGLVDRAGESENRIGTAPLNRLHGRLIRWSTDHRTSIALGVTPGEPS